MACKGSTHRSSRRAQLRSPSSVVYPQVKCTWRLPQPPPLRTGMKALTSQPNAGPVNSFCKGEVQKLKRWLVGCFRTLAGAVRFGLALAFAAALGLAGCKESPPPRQFNTLDDYLTYPDACVANTAKHIKASGRSWPNEEYPDPWNKGTVKIFDLWAGDRLYRIDSRQLNIFTFGGMKGEENHPLDYSVLKSSLVRIAGKEWVEQRGLPLNADVFGTIRCHNFASTEEEINWLNTVHPHGEPVRRLVSSSPNSRKPVGVKEWNRGSFGSEGEHISKKYSYAFELKTTQEVYGKRIEAIAWCSDRLGERYKNDREPVCSMKLWLGPGVALTFRMEPPAPEHIGEVFNLLQKYFEENRVR